MDEVNGNKIASADSERSTSSASSSSDEQVVVDFDDVLPHVGELGRYQVLLFLLTAPFCFFLAFCYFSQVFITLVPDHWCHVPQLNNSALNQQQKRELSIPRVEPDFLGGPLTFSTCSMYDVNYEDVLRNNLQPDSSWQTIACTHGWDYDLEQTTYSTVVSEFDWVCGDAGKPPLAQALFFCGSIAGGVLMGYIADRFGRVPALMLCNTLGSLAGIITAFSNTFALFAFSRFMMGMAFDSCFTLMYILVLEYVGPKYRTVAANLSIALFYSTGSVLLPWIAWAIGDWRKFSLATSVPMSFALLAYWIVPESARWLLSRGQSDRAIAILKTFARVNKKRPAESVFQQLKVSTEEARQAVANEPVHTALDLLKTPRLRRNTIFLTLLWVLTAVVYDGHARNTANLPLDVFSVFSLAAVTELPAALCLIIFLDRWGRRLLAFLGLIGASVFSLATLAVPPEAAVLTAALAIIGRFCVNVTFDIGLQYAAELIPTAVRAQGISYVHICGYLAAIFSPYIVDLARFNNSLPLTVLGLLALIGAVMALMLPETLGAILPDTIEDGENFGKDQSFWDFPCCTNRRRGGNSKPTTAARDQEEDDEKVRRPSRSSLTASLRGEIYRSSLFNNKSYSSRPKSKKLVNIKPIRWIKTESA